MTSVVDTALELPGLPQIRYTVATPDPQAGSKPPPTSDLATVALDSVPSEVLEGVVGKLGVRDLCHLAQASKQHRVLAVSLHVTHSASDVHLITR